MIVITRRTENSILVTCTGEDFTNAKDLVMTINQKEKYWTLTPVVYSSETLLLTIPHDVAMSFGPEETKVSLSYRNRGGHTHKIGPKIATLRGVMNEEGYSGN